MVVVKQVTFTAERQAYERGLADFSKGRHANPYHPPAYVPATTEESELAAAWDIGQNAGRVVQDERGSV